MAADTEHVYQVPLSSCGAKNGPCQCIDDHSNDARISTNPPGLPLRCLHQCNECGDTWETEWRD